MLKCGDRIKAAIGRAQPAEAAAPPVLPQASRELSATEAARPVVVEDTTNVIRPAARERRWRNLATATSAIAAALVALIAVGLYRPGLLPVAFRPRAQTQTAEVNCTTRFCFLGAICRRAAEGRRIARLHPYRRWRHQGFYHSQGRRHRAPDPGKSFELWLISDQLPQPRSLGVIGNGDFTARALLASYDTNIVNGATYAVTMEQGGGAPDGIPHSTPIYTGKLIETVPATAPK